MTDKNTIQEGLRLKEFRKNNGISQKEMANQLDCSQPNLSKIENGELGISSSLRELLFSKYPKLNPNWLFAGLGEMTIESYDHEMISQLKNEGKEESKIWAYFEKFQKLVEQGKVPNAVVSAILSDITELYNIKIKEVEALKEENKALTESIKLNNEIIRRFIAK